DQNGNTLVYDAWNRLVEAKDGSTSLVRHEFDALKRRIVEGQTAVYFSVNWQAIEERDTVSGDTVTQYVWSPVYIDAMILRDYDTDSNGTLDQRLYIQHDANFNVRSGYGVTTEYQLPMQCNCLPSSTGPVVEDQLSGCIVDAQAALIGGSQQAG